MSSPALNESVFLKACRLEKTPYTPVWLMRQAGRYMKDYRDIRDKTSFLDLCKNKDLVTEVTVYAQEKLNADAAIIFSDILLLAESFGLGLDYLKGDGPSIKKPIRSARDINSLKDIDPRESLYFVYDAIRQTRKALKPGIPLIGFAGAPFTLASYMIEGGGSDDFALTRKLMLSDEVSWKILLDKIAAATVKHLNAQIEAGAQAIQLFDSWVGNLNPEEYKKYAMPYSEKIFKNLKPGIPAIHFGTNTGKFLHLMSQAGGDVIGADHRILLDEAWERIGPSKAIQGNLDPKILCGDQKTILKEVKVILAQAGGRPGHIFNLGHGVLPETPVENAVAVVQMIHESSRGKV